MARWLQNRLSETPICQGNRNLQSELELEAVVVAVSRYKVQALQA
jgi:hypothetical protein